MYLDGLNIVKASRMCVASYIPQQGAVHNGPFQTRRCLGAPMRGWCSPQLAAAVVLVRMLLSVDLSSFRDLVSKLLSAKLDL